VLSLFDERFIFLDDDAFGSGGNGFELFGGDSEFAKVLVETCLLFVGHLVEAGMSFSYDLNNFGGVDGHEQAGPTDG
jgi:hypothetical protein